MYIIRLPFVAILWLSRSQDSDLFHPAFWQKNLPIIVKRLAIGHHLLYSLWRHFKFDLLRRGKTDQADWLYSLYATSALSNHNRQHPCKGRKPELIAAPVWPRYSFSGPSMSYRWHFYYSSSVLFVSLANFFVYYES